MLEGELVGRRPNLSPRFITELEERLGLGFVDDGRGDLQNTFGPDDVFHYIYAVLSSPEYRSRYVEFLRHDFPRVPVPGNAELFAALAAMGEKLIGLHLFETQLPDATDLSYPVPGTNVVEAGHPRYLGPGNPDPLTGNPLDVGRVYISKDKQSGKRGQYFRGVSPEVWEYEVGGYQVCSKWLRDRRGSTLVLTDLTHYERLLSTIRETLRTAAEIDSLIPLWPLDMAGSPVMLEARDMVTDLLEPLRNQAGVVRPEV